MKYQQTFDPIVSAALLPPFGSAPGSESPDAHTASVFVPAVAGADEQTARIGFAPTLRQRLRRRYWRYEIDMRHHPVVLRFSLPAREEALAFNATVTLLWAVRNPVEVALHGVRDLKPVLWTFLDQTLRGVSRQFSIEEVQSAEAEMRSVLDKEGGEIGFGLRLPMLAVSLQVDEDTERYLSQRVQSGRDGNLAGDRHDLARQEAEYEQVQAAWRGRLDQERADWQGQLERVQAEWRGRLDRAQAVHSRELDAARAEHRHELDVAEAQHARAIEQAQAAHRHELDAAQAEHAREVERLNTENETRLKGQRLAFYREALSGGHHDAVVLQLIENPHDIGEIMRLVAAGTEKHYERSREVMKDLLANQLANAADMDALTQHTIGELQTALSAAGPRKSRVIEEA